MKNTAIGRYMDAIEVISSPLKEALAAVNDEIKEQTQEVRLRQNKPLTLVGLYGTCFIGRKGRISYLGPENAVSVTTAQVNDTLSKLCSYSVYAHQDSLSKGFITFGSGCRAGICGSAVMENSAVKSVKNINSINIRVAREHIGAADEAVKLLYGDGLKNIIISGPPASGKTTLLRDLSRQLSSGKSASFYKVALIDERCELAGANNGEYMNNVGVCADVLSGFPKAEAVIQAVRTMSPEYIICDELGSLEEVNAIAQGINSGVKFALSVHAGSMSELLSRPQVKKLLALNAFEFAVMLKSSRKPCEIEEIKKLDDCYDENFGGGSHFDVLNINRRAFIERRPVKSNGA